MNYCFVCFAGCPGLTEILQPLEWFREVVGKFTSRHWTDPDPGLDNSCLLGGKNLSVWPAWFTLFLYLLSRTLPFLGISMCVNNTLLPSCWEYIYVLSVEFPSLNFKLERLGKILVLRRLTLFWRNVIQFNCCEKILGLSFFLLYSI